MNACRKIRPRTVWRRGISIIEVLVVIGIIGLLVGMLLPAVQAARETARFKQCGGNLKNIAIALADFHSFHKSFPAGSDELHGTEHAWSSRILPFIEMGNIAQSIDYKKPWNDPGANATAAGYDIPLYVCPSSQTRFPGKQDYGGILGTALLYLPAGAGPNDAFGCGTLIITCKQQAQPVMAAQITDGLSCTMAGGESVDRLNGQAGLWACGRNCFSQNEPSVVISDFGSLFSFHPGGAQAWFCDGHVRVIRQGIDPEVLGALCTRNGAEASANAAFVD
jgi:prepilin-type processing-associated H-X9-DG protein